jgi:hypothetical protein
MADAIAGPSRAATVKDEAEDYADSTTVAAATNGSSSTAANAKGANANDDETTAEELGPDGLPKDASETLYLHNLNEKVQISGGYRACVCVLASHCSCSCSCSAHRSSLIRFHAQTL